MDAVKKICSNYFKGFEGECDTLEFKEKSRECDEAYEDLRKELTE